MSKHGKKPLNSSYFVTNYPAVYAAAERIFGSWKSTIEACGLDYSTIRKYKVRTKDVVINEIKKSGHLGSRSRY